MNKFNKITSRTSQVDTNMNFFKLDTVIEAFNKARLGAGKEKAFELKDTNAELGTGKSLLSQNDGGDIPPDSILLQSYEDFMKDYHGCVKLRWNPDGIVDGDEEDDGLYVCEYCDRLGYFRKYVPEICDSCRICESCVEYIDEDCSGCSFSVYRDGKYYRDKIPESELLSEADVELFAEIEKDDFSKDIRKPDRLPMISKL